MFQGCGSRDCRALKGSGDGVIRYVMCYGALDIIAVFIVIVIVNNTIALGELSYVWPGIRLVRVLGLKRKG